MGAFLFKQIHTLDRFSFSFLELNKKWGCDKRYGIDALQRFLLLNHRALDFLNVHAEIEVIGNAPKARRQRQQQLRAPLLRHAPAPFSRTMGSV